MGFHRRPDVQVGLVASRYAYEPAVPRVDVLEVVHDHDQAVEHLSVEPLVLVLPVVVSWAAVQIRPHVSALHGTGVHLHSVCVVEAQPVADHRPYDRQRRGMGHEIQKHRVERKKVEPVSLFREMPVEDSVHVVDLVPGQHVPVDDVPIEVEFVDFRIGHRDDSLAAPTLPGGRVFSRSHRFHSFCIFFFRFSSAHASRGTSPGSGRQNLEAGWAGSPSW